MKSRRSKKTQYKPPKLKLVKLSLIIKSGTSRIFSTALVHPLGKSKTQQSTHREIMLETEALWSEQFYFIQYLLDASEINPPNKSNWWFSTCLRSYKNIYEHNLPIYTRHINYNINHVTAKFIWLHIHRRTVCCNVDFADNIEEKSFFNTWILEKNKIKCSFFKESQFVNLSKILNH